ncbi:beta-galactosidase [Sphingobacteriaceae bacterium WQ 2009]|uniref:Beta-galactosidase n=1 Tax=Rhinopithecimicrobium faecis TaxID=2820698 RepID=A0A8T4H9S5_9SPHI|nr:beta-galactosidase [Sphingobacteriaceae bacterium WQ 2009]
MSVYNKILLAGLFFLSAGSLTAREVIPFNQNWGFKRGPFTANNLNYSSIFSGKWQMLQLPHTWNATDMQSDVVKAGSYSYNERFYVGDGFYRKTFSPDKSWQGKRVFVKFEGVNSQAEIFLNNAPLEPYKFVGSHKGGYSAFTLELTTMLKYGQENELLVKVNNEASPDVIPVNHVLFPMYGGIYRPVELIVTEDINIAVDDFAGPGLYITQKNVSKKSADIGVKIKLENKTGAKQEVEVFTAIVDASGKQKSTSTTLYNLLPQGRQEVFQQLKITSPHLWHGIQDPYLYKVVTQIRRAGKLVDEVTQPLGVRKFELRASEGFYLNDVKYPLYGVTRHQDRWGKGAALSQADHDEDLAIITEMGATSIRLAHYQQSEYFYSRCDSLGLIVWAEIPFVNQVTGKEENNALQQLKELVRQNFNHPSIYIWGLHNEVYYENGSHANAAHTIALTSKLHDLAKSEDPDRYTVSVNGYNVIDHVVNNKADVQGVNHYFGWYNGELENLSPNEDDVETWATRIGKDFRDYRIIYSEYGAEAVPEDQAELVGNTGNQFSKPAFFPEEFATKFHIVNWATIEKNPIFIGSYLWNMFDFATPITRLNVRPRNYKGIVSFDRKTKKDSFYWYKANWSATPVVYITQRRVVNRGNEFTKITIFSNQGMPTLLVNGKEIKGLKNGYNKIHFEVDNVQLKQGENNIVAQVEKGGVLTRDEILWNYDAKYKRELGEKAFTKDEHVGL